MLKVRQAALFMQRFACAVLPRIDNILGAQSTIPKPTVCSFFRQDLSLKVARMVECHMRLRTPQLNGLKAQTLLHIKPGMPLTEQYQAMRPRSRM